MIPDMSVHDAPLRVFTMSDMRTKVSVRSNAYVTEEAYAAAFSRWFVKRCPQRCWRGETREVKRRRASARSRAAGRCALEEAHAAARA